MTLHINICPSSVSPSWSFSVHLFCDFIIFRIATQIAATQPNKQTNHFMATIILSQSTVNIGHMEGRRQKETLIKFCRLASLQRERRLIYEKRKSGILSGVQPILIKRKIQQISVCRGHRIGFKLIMTAIIGSFNWILVGFCIIYEVREQGQ